MSIIAAFAILCVFGVGSLASAVALCCCVAGARSEGDRS